MIARCISESTRSTASDALCGSCLVFCSIILAVALLVATTGHVKLAICAICAIAPHRAYTGLHERTIVLLRLYTGLLAH
eukprot:7381867-Prymnesium_polylepis.1